jgi:hypothetical protein
MNNAFTRLPPVIEFAVSRIATAEDRPVSATLRMLVKEALSARRALPEIAPGKERTMKPTC